MKIRAAVLDRMGTEPPYARSKPLRVAEVALDPPGRGEVLVRVAAAGLCHSDLSVINGDRPRPMPMALGHEAAGVVDLTAFAIFDITGPGALGSVQQTCVAQCDVAVGKVIYTPVLDAKGGFKSDLTVMRLGEDHFRVVTGGAHGKADQKWFADHLADQLRLHADGREPHLERRQLEHADHGRLRECASACGRCRPTNRR